MVEYFALLFSIIAIFVSLYAVGKSTQSQYYQEFYKKLDKLVDIIHSYEPERDEPKCKHYLELISRQKNNHIDNKDKQNIISECCTKIRRLLPALSNTKTQDKNITLKHIFNQVELIEIDVKDFNFR